MKAVRIIVPLGIAAVAGAALGLLQVTVAELTDITTLGGDFGGGNDRVQGAQVTLIAWYCAMAVPLAATIAGARRHLSVRVRAAAGLAAAAGTLATYPLVSAVSGAGLRHDCSLAVVTGVLLGLVGAVAVAAAPAVGRGLACYVALLWVAALALTELVSNTVTYAGLVQPVGLDFLDSLWSSLPDLPYNLGYHLPTMLPAAVVILILAGVLSGVTARRTGAWPSSTAAGAIGPVLAALVYRFPPRELSLWNESAGALVFALAGCCLLVSAVTAVVFRRRTRVDRAPESAGSAEDGA